MPKVLSDETKNILINSKETAKRLGNNYIGIGHYILCLDRHNRSGRLNLNITLSDKKNIVRDLKGKRLDLKGKREYVLTKQLEEACKLSRFNSWLLNDKVVNPEHIYMGILGFDVEQKLRFYQLLRESYIELDWLRKLLIGFYFTKAFRWVGKYLFYRM